MVGGVTPQIYMLNMLSNQDCWRNQYMASLVFSSCLCRYFTRQGNIIYVFIIHFQLAEECMNTRNKASLFNMSYFGKLFLSGPDATKACEWIFSNNMEKAPGKTSLCGSCSCLVEYVWVCSGSKPQRSHDWPSLPQH